MKRYARRLGLLGLLCAPMAFGSTIVLDFEGVGDEAQILEFYNGGWDSDGNSGADVGVSFSSNALGLIDYDAGGTGNHENTPSGDTVLFFLSGTSAVLNYEAGFDTGLAFYYSASEIATVVVWDGLNASGNILATISLAAQHDNGCSGGDPKQAYCNWTAIGTGFDGIAKSVDFIGSANFVGFDDVTLGSITPGEIPLPGTLGLLGLGLAGLGVTRRRRSA